MCKVYDIKSDNLILSALYDKKLSLGDYEGAISAVRRMENEGIDSESVYFYYATAYFKAQMYFESLNNWFRYLSVCNDKKRARAYNGIGACFFKLGDVKKAGHYFNLQMSLKPKNVLPYDDVLKEFYTEVTNVKNAYHLAYPYEKADFSILLDKCYELAKQEKYEQVLNELKVIPKTSKYYGQALVQKAICHFFLENNELAVNYAKEAVFEDPKNINAICNAISILNACNKPSEAKVYVEKLKAQVSSLDEEDAVKAIMVLSDAGEFLLAKKIAYNHLSKNKCDVHVLYILGFIEYSLKNYEKAKEAFLKNYRLTQNVIAKFYSGKCNEALEKQKAGKRVKKLPFNLDLPDEEKYKICQKIAKKPTKKVKELSRELEEICEYCFTVPSEKVAYLAIDMLFEIKSEKCVQFLKKKLLSINVFDTFKRAIISCFILEGYNGELSVVLGGKFKKIKLEKVDFYGDNAEIFKYAYAYLVAETCAFVDDLSKLKDGALEVYGSLILSGNEQNVDDYNALSAVMFEVSGVITDINKTELASFFNTSTKKVKKVRELYRLAFNESENVESKNLENDLALKEIAQTLDEN